MISLWVCWCRKLLKCQGWLHWKLPLACDLQPKKSKVGPANRAGVLTKHPQNMREHVDFWVCYAGPQNMAILQFGKKALEFLALGQIGFLPFSPAPGWVWTRRSSSRTARPWGPAASANWWCSRPRRRTRRSASWWNKPSGRMTRGKKTARLDEFSFMYKYIYIILYI